MYRGATIWARKTVDSDVFFLKPDKWFKIWFYLVTRANYEDNGQFKRGESLVRYADISEACGATKSQVDHAIRWFKNCQMLATRKATRGMFISILNYNTYQSLDNYKSDSSGDLKAKQKRHRSDTIKKKTKKTKKTKKNTPLPPELETPEFQKTWGEWEQHRTEIKKILTPSTIARQLKMLSKFTPATAIAMIDQSICGGWTGLFELKDNYGNGQTTKTNPRKPSAEKFTGPSAYGTTVEAD